jgi:hypothetical protein
MGPTHGLRSRLPGTHAGGLVTLVDILKSGLLGRASTANCDEFRDRGRVRSPSGAWRLGLGRNSGRATFAIRKDLESSEISRKQPLGATSTPGFRFESSLAQATRSQKVLDHRGR